MRDVILYVQEGYGAKLSNAYKLKKGVQKMFGWISAFWGFLK